MTTSKHCEICGCIPCQCERIKFARKHGSTRCDSCDCKLEKRGGYNGMDLCPVCCTGEADSITDVELI